MTTQTNHWKLGLFVLVGTLLTIATIALLGARSMREEVGSYVTYFDESVQGLQVGSPIKFRGVTIGAVAKIDVASDHRHVEVTSELGKAVLSRLGLDVAKGVVNPEADKKLEQAIDLRAQLAAAGVTGVKFLQLDFFTVVDHPKPELPFTVPKNYIPATFSTMKDLEDTLVRTLNSLPEITDQVKRILNNTDRLISNLSNSGLSEDLRAGVVGLRDATNRANSLLARIDGDNGLLRSVERTSNAVGDAARNAGDLEEQLNDSMQSVKEAAKSIQRLASALEQDPDMLMKGRNQEDAR